MLTITISTKAAVIAAATFLLAILAVPLAVSRAEDGEPAAAVESRAPVSTAFQYQGRLELNGVPANGTHTIGFTLYSDAVANATVGNPITATMPVTNGVFSVPLDFGVNAFNGEARWLGMEVLVGNSFVPMGPRQELRATPYALHSLTTGPHDHTGQQWGTISNGAFGLWINSQGFNTKSLILTNAGDCSVAGRLCYGLYSIANYGAGGSGYGGVGVYGEGSNAGVIGKGPQFGVYGDSPDVGIRGASSGVSSGVLGTGFNGVQGQSSGDEGAGVRGVMTGSGAGVSAEASGANSTGLQSFASGTNTDAISAVATGDGSVGISASGDEWAGVFLGWIQVTGGIRADDVLPTYPFACTNGCYVGDTNKPWTAMYATNFYGLYNAPSDSRLKRDITGLPYGLAEVLALRPVSYSMIDDESGKTRLGLIAQEVEQVLPEVVTPPASEDAFYAMSYDDLVPVLIKAMQELDARVAAQQEEIMLLKAALGIE